MNISLTSLGEIPYSAMAELHESCIFSFSAAASLYSGAAGPIDRPSSKAGEVPFLHILVTSNFGSFVQQIGIEQLLCTVPVPGTVLDAGFIATKRQMLDYQIRANRIKGVDRQRTSQN